MKAMIFAAGLGTRLKELTLKKPKALITLNGKPLIEHVIEHLISYQIKEIIINVHHHSKQLIQYIEDNKKRFNTKFFFSDETAELLDTGGGLKKAAWFFDNKKPFIVCNADIISNINITDLFSYHIHSNCLATLAVRKRNSSRYFLFNTENNLCGWKNLKSGEEIISRESTTPLGEFAFSGIQIINPSIFELIKETGKFSITKSYINLSKDNIIKGYLHNNDYWFDLGTAESLAIADSFLNKKSTI